jgi:hypothetical protein
MRPNWQGTLHETMRQTGGMIYMVRRYETEGSIPNNEPLPPKADRFVESFAFGTRPEPAAGQAESQQEGRNERPKVGGRAGQTRRDHRRDANRAQSARRRGFVLAVAGLCEAGGSSPGSQRPSTKIMAATGALISIANWDILIPHSYIWSAAEHGADRSPYSPRTPERESRPCPDPGSPTDPVAARQPF